MSERWAYVSDPAECQCCGFATHRVADCPFKGLHDTNHQMKAKYGPPPATIDQVVASLVPDTNTLPTISSSDCKCAAHNGLANRTARGNEGCQLPGNEVVALAVWTDETPRPGVDLPPTPSNTPLTESEDILHPVYVKPSGIIVSVDELNNEKVDTFGAFFSNNKKLHRVEDDAQAFLQQFVFDGSDVVRMEEKVDRG